MKIAISEAEARSIWTTIRCRLDKGDLTPKERSFLEQIDFEVRQDGKREFSDKQLRWLTSILLD